MLLLRKSNASNHFYNVKSSRTYLKADVSCLETLIRARLAGGFYGMEVKANAS